ncbi:MAG: FAD-binding oxidoreductase [Syntrophomonadaceae bacterium]|nr:FAD-binding oxidoreductase [Syntrophomonadaceae bacterium]
MKTEVQEQIKKEFDERATDSAFECSFYTRDLAPVPDFLVDPLFKTRPDMVVRPQNTAEVAQILKIADENRIPVTPRAGGSTVYFNSIPTRGGILMDLNLIKGIKALNKDEMTVTVRAATTWSELEEYLNRQGLAAKSYPSSAPVATIGGWFSMMGYGVGSLKYGNLLSQLRSIKVVFPAGEIKIITSETSPSLDWFACAEGTLGIITELELEVRSFTPMCHYLLQVHETKSIASIITTLKDAAVKPYNLHFSDKYYNQAMRKLGFTAGQIEDANIIAVDYEGEESELKEAAEIVAAVVAGNKSVKMLNKNIALKEWEERFKALKLKRGGPSQLGAEICLPIEKLGLYLKEIDKVSSIYRLGLTSYGHVVDRGHLTVMTMFYADETEKIGYVIGLSLVKKIQDAGYKYGGYPYGIGLWNTPYLKRIFTPANLAQIRTRKKTVDQKNIINPGKVYKWPFLFHPLTFSLGCNVMAATRRICGKGEKR